MTPDSADLARLTIGNLSLTPMFDPDETEYSAETTNQTNKVTAVAEDENAVITILNGEMEVENGSSATWSAGENTLTIHVTNGEAEKVYTVTVTKS